MKKLSEKGRKVLRRVFMGLGVAAVSMTFAACYGVPPPSDDDLDLNDPNRTENSTPDEEK